jgi:hypothetical protein
MVRLDKINRSRLQDNAKRPAEDLISFGLAFVINFVRSHAILKSWALNLICKFPMLQARLYRIILAKGSIADGTIVEISDASKITPKARLIYANLKNAIERQNKEDH